MRNRGNLNNFFRQDRKTLYMVLSVLVLSIFTLTVVYASLSTTLNITGNAEVTAASWDIYLDNIQLNSGSATTTDPTIANKTTATFSTTLTKPGDFYEFTIDVVNDGSIEAMIDSVEKTPTLTETQAKYINYIIQYQNGEAITTKQLVEKNSYVRLKVKVEFRKDISSSDLPTHSETLNLSFKVNYVQSDETGTSVDNNGKLVKIVSGDLDTVGSEICIGEECFYVISSDEDSVVMFAKYNLYIGNECTSASASSCTTYGEEATGLQDSTMIGHGLTPRKGVIAFSSINYWSSTVNDYPVYVYDSNSSIFTYVENYKSYLENQGVAVDEARLIKVEELELLGCSRSSSSCSETPEWVYATSYWTGTAGTSSYVVYVGSNHNFNSTSYYYVFNFGVRPVITISKSEF